MSSMDCPRCGEDDIEVRGEWASCRECGYVADPEEFLVEQEEEYARP